MAALGGPGGGPRQRRSHAELRRRAVWAATPVAAANIIERMDDISPDKIQQSLMQLSTIDLRTDFLRPGRGKEFIATARIIRNGNKVAVSRMELHNELGVHIAFGTGTYMVG